MKRFLLGAAIGLFLGWATVPIVEAIYTVAQSDRTAMVKRMNDEDDFKSSHAYKWYLQQILAYMKSMDQSLKNLDVDMKAVKDKLHA